MIIGARWARQAQIGNSVGLGQVQSFKRALETAGVEFLEPTEDGKGEGVRFKSAKGKH
jgi:hypothetical protein